jgi:hypothetical protein
MNGNIPVPLNLRNSITHAFANSNEILIAQNPIISGGAEFQVEKLGSFLQPLFVGQRCGDQISIDS